jgi:DnaJ-class molecular chaperone
MSHSEVCPVCKGLGKVFDATIPNYGITTSNIYNQATCHGCNGKGWVQVEDTEIQTTIG